MAPVDRLELLEDTGAILEATLDAKADWEGELERLLGLEAPVEVEGGEGAALEVEGAEQRSDVCTVNTNVHPLLVGVPTCRRG